MSGGVVADSTCLIVLDRIRRLDILRAVYPDVCVPSAVQQEVGGLPDWLTVIPVRDLSLVSALETQLDRGESEAIALSMELGAMSVILDEKKARRIASQMGLHVVGTLAVLLRARRNGIIAEVKPLLNEMDQAGFHMTSNLYKEALRLAGET